MPMRRLLLALSLVFSTLPALAGNIDLATLPPRDSVQLTIYNAEDLTLVRERRVLSFKQGSNPLQFSWANTLIDPTSVELRFVDQAQDFRLVDTTFPHDRPQVLYWTVESQRAQQAMVEILYFTSGIRWSADYLAVADAQEKQLDLTSFVRVTNHSGEDYPDAQVRLVLGNINLVEKIAQLAYQMPDQLYKEEMADVRQRATKMAMMEAVGAAMPAPAAKPMLQAKEVAKQALSEYFIYTIEGTETIPNGWAKQLRSFHADDVPLKIEYRYRPRQYGEQLVRLYTLRNDKESKLGQTPLPEGPLQVYRDQGSLGLSYLGKPQLNYVPIGDLAEINLGQDPQVVLEPRSERLSRDNLWMRVRGVNIYKRADDLGAQTEINAEIAGWDEHRFQRPRIRNFSNRPVNVELRWTFDGDVRFKSALNTRLYDVHTVQVNANAAAGQDLELPYELMTRYGYNAKQNRVELATP